MQKASSPLFVRRLLKRHIRTLSVLAALLVNSSASLADNATKNTAGLFYNAYHQSAAVFDRSYDFDPQGLLLYFGFQPTDAFSLQLNGGKSKDETRRNNLRGSLNTEGYGASLSYRVNDWTITPALSLQDDDVSLVNDGLVFLDSSQKSRYQSFSLSLAHTFNWTDAWIELGIAPEYQTSSEESKSMVRSERGEALEETSSKGEGWLTTFEIAGGYFFSLNENTALLPSWSVSWSENISGETRGNYFTGARGPRGLQHQNTSFTQAQDSSGQFQLSLGVSMSSILVDLTASFAFDDSTSLTDMDDNKWLSAGARYFF